jgi:signal transduction histidine kinase
MNLNLNWWTILRFADHGIMIDPAYRKQVFDRFCRLHLQDRYPGTARGLTIVKKAVSLNEWEIEILAAEPQGTIAEVRLPKIRESQPSVHEI